MKEIQPLPVPQTDFERQAVNEFANNVQVVIQTCDEVEYYAALGLSTDLTLLKLKTMTMANQCNILILSCQPKVVGTIAGITRPKLPLEKNWNTELETIVKDVFTSTKLLGLAVCYGLTNNEMLISRLLHVVVASDNSKQFESVYWT